MEIVVRSRDIEVTAALREHVQRKVHKLDRLLEGKGDGPAEVRLTVERGRHIAEVTVPLNGYLLRGEERGADMYASVDHVIQKLERQLKKLRTRGHRPRQPLVAAQEVAAVAEGDIVRTKRFPAKPMTPDEAVLQMNLIGHDFFAFHNSDVDTFSVVYRRNDGNYGLLVPDR